MIRSATLGWPAFWMIGIVSIGCLFPFLILMGSSLSASGGEDADLIGVPGKLVSDPRFWLALLCSTVMALLPDVLTAGMQRLCAPADYQILQVRSLLCVSTRLTCEHLCSSNLAAHFRHATRLIFRHALPQSYRGHCLDIVLPRCTPPCTGSGCKSAQHRNRAAPCRSRWQQHRGASGRKRRTACAASHSSWPAHAGVAICFRVSPCMQLLCMLASFPARISCASTNLTWQGHWLLMM